MATERNRRPDGSTAPDSITLIAEIRRYLEAVDVFRREGCEPRWASGGVPEPKRP